MSQESHRSRVPVQQELASQDKKDSPIPVNWRVFAGAALGVIAISLWALIWPASAQTVLEAVVGWVASSFGWFYILTATAVVVFILMLAGGKQGNIRLGPDHSRPQYPLFSWAAMLFAAGIGVDLMFYSVLEPVVQYYTPPQGSGQNLEAARQAVVWTLFHYGITGWAMYALMGMAFGYFAFRYNLPLSIRSALYPMIGKRIQGRMGDAVDISALLGTVFGVATSLGIGVVQINYGLQFLFGWPQGNSIQLGLILVSVALAIASAVSGVDKGIRRLSELNVLLALLLMLYVLVMGKTETIMNAIIMNTGDYLSRFPGMTLNTMAYDHPTQWMNGWTLFFWAWWVAWSPFVGLFLARISRGRTIREFVLGTMTIPFAFILLWISIFGNAALELIYQQGNQDFGQRVLAEPERAFYALLEQYPGAVPAAAVATFTGLLFYVTSADSGALVMSNFASKIEDPHQDGPAWMRVFWAIATGLLTAAMLLIGGIATLQAATIVFGLPFALVLYLVMFGLWKALRVERHQLDSQRAALAGIQASNRLMTIGPASDQRNWRQRLARSVSYPGQKAIKRYMAEVVSPAIEDVARALQEEGVKAHIDSGHDDVTQLPYISLVEYMEGEQDFCYQVYPVASQTPTYLLASGKEDDIYFRLEPFAITGSRGYNIYGYTKDQLIHDILDNHERHLEFIRLSGTTPVEVAQGSAPVTGATQIIGPDLTVTDWSADFRDSPESKNQQKKEENHD